VRPKSQEEITFRKCYEYGEEKWYPKILNTLNKTMPLLVLGLLR
jgi:hypothetical protein